MEFPAVKEPPPPPPEEAPSDVSTPQHPLLNDRSETPDSNRADSVTSSPKISKPVLGKAQAKKRLMAFAKFNVTVKQALDKSKEKLQAAFPKDPDQKSKSDLSKTTGNVEHSMEPPLDSEDDQKSQTFSKKSKKLSEKKLPAIEEIIQEEVRRKQIMASGIPEKPSTLEKTSSRTPTDPRLRDSGRRARDNRSRNWEDSRRFNARFPDRKSPYRSSFGASDTSRRRRTPERDRGRSRRERRRSTSPENPNPRGKDSEKDDSLDPRIDRRSRGRWSRNRSRSYSEAESNWRTFKSQGQIIRSKTPHIEPPNVPIDVKLKNPQEYKSHFDQMLMVSDMRSLRTPVLVNGIDDGMREYPPESIRITRRIKGMVYSENPNVALYLSKRRLTQVLPPERCRIMREISDSEFKELQTYEAPLTRNWYKRIDCYGRLEIVRRSSLTDPLGDVPPKSRWELEEDTKVQEDDTAEEFVGKASEDGGDEEVTNLEEEKIEETREDEEIEEGEVTSGLASEYEEFMKMVSIDPDCSAKDSSLSPEVKSLRPISKAVEIDPKKLTKIEEEVPREDSGEEKTVLPEEETSTLPETIIVEVEKPVESPELSQPKDPKSLTKKILQKKPPKRRQPTSTETSDSSSSDSEFERRKRKRRRKKKKKIRDSSTSSSSSDDSSSEDLSKKRRKNSKRRRRKYKKLKLQKKKSRKDSSDSDSSSSSERSHMQKTKNVISKHSNVSKPDRSSSLEKQKVHTIKKEIDEDDFPLEKNSISTSLDISGEQESLKIEQIKIKIEKNITPSASEQEDGEIMEAVERNLSKSPEFQLEKEKIAEKELTDQERIASIPIPDEVHPLDILKPEEIPLPLTPMASRDIPLPPTENVEKELLEKKRKIELELLKTRKPKSSQRKRRFFESSTSSSSSSSSYSSSSSTSGDSETEKKERDRRSRSQGRSKSSRVIKRPKKCLTEFDFDFPSLTQLEKTGTLIDDWEVDSMEDMEDLPKDKPKKLKKMEKEVRYDQKTDTYIAVEKELAKGSKKKQAGRVCLRIWEDEEEEGEREALLMKSDPATAGEGTLVEEGKTKEEGKTEKCEDFDNQKDEKWLGITEEISITEEKPLEVRPRWDKKSSDLSTDPPTPEGPLMPVNWEEEEEWTSSLKPVEIKPVPPASSDKTRSQTENSKNEEKPEDRRRDFSEHEKVDLYSPSSPADSHKSETGLGSSESSESTSGDRSSDSSCGSPPHKVETTRIDGPPGEEMKSSTPPLVSLPKIDDFLIEKSPENPQDTLHQLKSDMFSKLREQDLEKIEDKEKEADVTSKKTSKVSAEAVPKAPAESSHKSKEVFKNTFVEIGPQSSRSPDRRRISPRDSEKSRARISEERTSNSSYRSSRSSAKELEKPKIEEKRRDRSSSPRRRSPGERKYRRSPSWRKRHSRSRSRSWSRSRSRSLDRRDRQQRFRHPGDGRERYSPGRSRGRERRDWSPDKSLEKSYDPLEIFRGSKRFESRRLEAPREGSESQDPYDVRRLLELPFDDRSFSKERSLDRDLMDPPIIPPLCPDLDVKCRFRRERGREEDWDRREGERMRRRSPERRRERRRSPRRGRERDRDRERDRERERERFVSRSRSKSWSRSPARSRERSNSRGRERSRERSRRQSMERVHSLERVQTLERIQSRRKSRSRSPSPRRRRPERFRRSLSGDRGRKIETIMHPSGMNPPAPEESTILNEGTQVPSNFRYQQEPPENFTYYPSNNLTYPPRVEDSSGSPKRLSLDDRLELELGIKKSQEVPIYPSTYPHMLPASSIPLPASPAPGAIFHRPPTLLQVGNVLQVVPRDYQPAGVPPVLRANIPPSPVPPAANGNRVLRVGNVLEVVPTTNLDWAAGGAPLVNLDRPPPTFPPPLVASVSSSPHPVPVPVPQVLAPPVLPKLSQPKAPPAPQPVYNYEAILEARKKEKEERRRLREERRSEKENRRIIRMRKRAEKVLDKVARTNETAEEVPDTPEDPNKLIDDEHEESVAATLGETSGDVKEFGGDFDEDEEVDLEGDVEEDEEEEDEVEESEEDQEDEDSRVIPGLGDLKECEQKIDVEGSVEVLPVPKKGILVPPGLWANRLLNGDDEEGIEAPEGSNESENEGGVEELGDEEEREKRMRTRKARAKRKAVQFADGVKPGEGTSPSGGEGDMPSPPPPLSSSIHDPVREMVKKRMRKRERKKPKRVKVMKTKKKVKVKIIKLKKPRITPLTALMLDDSDEMDDRSPPPPPPGSPPPPHLWPSYLAAYSATLKAVESVVSPPSVTQTAPPPTPLPLLVPPPPLNYTIQPLNKA
ncbi:serine/arginine repetitive matrix protein 2-like [Diachasmimorpha longicaudata]|uniref:serine/arginine repetitive matrix protein 2-like n=1 Tax=Diachasmimorpha longicaudata TaxID=58733 RepID=UPI0030B89275